MTDLRVGPRYESIVPPDLKHTDWAYLAGFMDGEGCIASYCHGQSGNYFVVITVSQVVPDPLLWARDTFKIGNVYAQVNPAYRNGGIWRWRMSGHPVVPLLRGLHPYLQVKQRQAALAISLMTRIDRKDKVIQRRIHLRLQELKRV